MTRASSLTARSRVVRGMFTIALALATGFGTVAAQQRPNFDVQLPEGQGSYPTGDLFIANLDTVWTAAGAPIAGASILIRDGVIRAIGTDLRAPDNVLAEIRLHRFELLDFNAHHALTAARLPDIHRDPFDRALIAQAKLENLVLMTHDARIKQYDLKTLDV